MTKFKEISPTLIYFGFPFGCCLAFTFALASWFALPFTAWNFSHVLILIPPCILTVEFFFHLVFYMTVVFKSLSEPFLQLADHYVISLKGMARGGKTLSGSAIVFLRSQVSWYKLCLKYYKMSKLQWLYRYYSQEVWMERWLEVKDSYEFWMANPQFIPCLMSSIRIKDIWGRRSKELHIEHLEQKERIPAYTYILLDEAGTLVGLFYSRNKNQSLINFIRWIGQFCEVHMILTEQRDTAIAIDIREVAGSTVEVEMKKKLQAVWGLELVEKLVLMGKKYGWSPKAFHRIQKLEDFFEKVGIFTFTFYIENNKGEKVLKTNMCCNMSYRYQSRAFSPMYKARDKSFGEDYSDGELVYPESPMGKAISNYEVLVDG